MNQTPASRRFLPPSSTSRPQNTSSSVRKVQFGQPSQHTSSSPFLRTPFSSTSKRRDDIETSFDEEPEPSTSEPIRSASMKVQNKGSDYIEDESEIGTAVQSSPHITSSSDFALHEARNRKHLDDEEANGGDNESDSELYKPKADFSSPLPKRQKVSHGRGRSVDAIQISSSPSASDNELDDLDTCTNQVEIDALGSDFYKIEQDKEDTLNEGHSSRSKFRVRSGASVKDQKPHTGQAPRSVFRGLVGNEFSALSAPLPVTFSPSKRRGKHDYIYGGAAETVRSWILDVANGQIETPEARSKNLDVVQISKDKSGRFDIVEDKQGRTWMLTHQETPKETLLSTKISGQKQFQSIVFKGLGTTWPISLSGPAIDKRLPDDIHVAVHWEALRAGKKQ